MTGSKPFTGTCTFGGHLLTQQIFNTGDVVKMIMKDYMKRVDKRLHILTVVFCVFPGGM